MICLCTLGRTIQQRQFWWCLHCCTGILGHSGSRRFLNRGIFPVLPEFQAAVVLTLTSQSRGGKTTADNLKPSLASLSSTEKKHRCFALLGYKTSRQESRSDGQDWAPNWESPPNQAWLRPAGCWTFGWKTSFCHLTMTRYHWLGKWKWKRRPLVENNDVSRVAYWCAPKYNLIFVLSCCIALSLIWKPVFASHLLFYWTMRLMITLWSEDFWKNYLFKVGNTQATRIDFNDNTNEIENTVD